MLPDLNEIRLKRKRLGLSQKELAKKVFASQSFIAKTESGKISPSYEKVKTIFNVLNRLEKKQEVKTKEISNRSVISVNIKNYVSDAVMLMKKKGISQLPVFDRNTVVGSISESVISDRILNGEDFHTLSRLEVRDIMEEAFPVIGEDMPITTVSELLHNSSAVLLAKQGKITGIVTKADLLKVVK